MQQQKRQTLDGICRLLKGFNHMMIYIIRRWYHAFSLINNLSIIHFHTYAHIMPLAISKWTEIWYRNLSKMCNQKKVMWQRMSVSIRFANDISSKESLKRLSKRLYYTFIEANLNARDLFKNWSTLCIVSNGICSSWDLWNCHNEFRAHIWFGKILFN